MEWRIPYFEYDLFTRVVPGALTIAVLSYAGMPMPAYWKLLLPVTTTSGELGSGLVLFGGLTLLAVSYLIGLIYDSTLARCFRRLSPRALKGAAKQRKAWRRWLWAKDHPLLADSAKCFREKDLWTILAQWLVCSKDEGVRLVYPHLWRMQAEAKLLIYSVLPLLVLSLIELYNIIWLKGSGSWWVAGPSVVLTMLLPFCGYFRERRRWQQALLILDELRPGDERADQLRLLQLQLEKYGID